MRNRDHPPDRLPVLCRYRIPCENDSALVRIVSYRRGQCANGVSNTLAGPKTGGGVTAELAANR
jgi:hypothetical protein